MGDSGVAEVVGKPAAETAGAPSDVIPPGGVPHAGVPAADDVTCAVLADESAKQQLTSAVGTRKERFLFAAHKYELCQWEGVVTLEVCKLDKLT